MEIFLFTLSVMYSPGPVNALGFNAGLHGELRRTVGFFCGVGVAIFIQLIVLGYAGEAFISKNWLPYLALAGAGYTLYLSIKVMTSVAGPSTQGKRSTMSKLTFMNGLVIQGVNPKSMLVVLPVTTVMFPAAHITGVMILIVSMLIGVGAGGAPALYSILGAILGKKLNSETHFTLFNRLMGVMLFGVGLSMFYDFLIGVGLI